MKHFTVRLFNRRALACCCVAIFSLPIFTAVGSGSFSAPVSFNTTFKVINDMPISSLTFAISPVAGLIAGEIPDATELAAWTLSNGDTPSRFGIKWGGRLVIDQSKSAVLSGTLDSTHHLRVRFTADDELDALNQGDYLSKNNMKELSGAIVSDGQQSVPADSYRAILDVALYHP